MVEALGFILSTIDHPARMVFIRRFNFELQKAVNP